MRYSKNNSICDRYYLEMLNSNSLSLVKQFIDEEAAVIKSLLETNCSKDSAQCFVGIGVGPLLYSHLGIFHCDQYIGVDPLIDQHCFYDRDGDLYNHPKVSIFSEDYSKFTLKREKKTSYFFAFVFNVLSYFDDKVRVLERNVQENDVIIVSTWSKKQASQLLRERYFNYLDRKSSWALGNRNSYLLNLEQFPIGKLKFYKDCQIIYGDYCDVMVIYT